MRIKQIYADFPPEKSAEIRSIRAIRVQVVYTGIVRLLCARPMRAVSSL